MSITVECLQGTVFDWCSGIIPIMKKKLSDYKRFQCKNFGYSSVLVAIFFERVPIIILAVPLLVFSPTRYPRLQRWGEIFLHHGGGGSVQSVYDDAFYLWWGRQLPALEHFPYASLDF